MSSFKSRPIFFCLVGPAGSGKTSLAKRLLADSNGSLKKIISATTRTIRPGEVDGVDYHFFSKRNFEQAMGRGEFFETEETHGSLYGQLKSSIAQALDGWQDVVFDIDIRGARSIKTSYPAETVVIFLLPPSKQVLSERMQGRAPISDQELKTRMQTAEREFRNLLDIKAFGGVVDYSLVNNRFEECLAQIKSVISAERLKFSRVMDGEIEKCWGDI